MFTSGDPAIVDRLVRADYIQHNPLFSDGPDALKHFGATMRQQYPEIAFDPRQDITDGDMVLLHSRSVLMPDTPGLAVFDIFRFQDGEIADHWDATQDVPETSANDNTMF